MTDRYMRSKPVDWERERELLIEAMRLMDEELNT